jgi:hypothetical protein
MNTQCLQTNETSQNRTFLAKRKVADTRKNGDQFHQQIKLQISSLNWHTFYQICLSFAKRHLTKKLYILFELYFAQKCW